MGNRNLAKQKLVQGGYAFGTWIIDARHQSIVRQIAEAGLDFIYFDMEHSGLSWETIADFCEMTRACNLTPIVRPADLTRASTLKLLEVGAMGVMFHDVDSREEVEEIRSWIMASKSMLRQDKARQSANDVSIVIQIETAKGLASVEKIMAGGGIDMVEIGRGDLAIELGHAAERNHPDVNAAIDRIVAACNKNDIVACVTVFSQADAEDMVRRGVRCLAYSADRYILDKVFREASAMLSRVVGK